MVQHLILITEFSLLLALGVFGSHRLVLVAAYLRSRSARPLPQQRFSDEELPLICVQLPVYNEGHLAGRILRQITQSTYPRDRLEIQVLDDSDDPECQAIARRAVLEYAARGFTVRHLSREHRQGFKAGALAWGLEQTEAKFVAIFDADFLPAADFFEKTIHYFSDSTLDMLQCRWGHANAEQSLLTRAQAALLDGHFQIEHSARNRSGYFFNFNGTAGIWRRTAIENAGGWQGDTLTEDLDLSYRAQLQGSKFLYLLEESVPAELPLQVSAFKSQQHRWTKGSIEVFFKLWRKILAAELAPRIKAEAFFHLAANFCYPLLLLTGLLVLPSMHAFVSLENMVSEQTALLLSGIRFVFFIGFASVFVFYFVAIRESRRLSLLRTFEDILLALSTGIGLSLSNSIAVTEAILGRKSSFIRTPKSGNLTVSNEPEKSLPPQQGRIKTNWRLWLPFLETGLALYFVYTLHSAISLGRFEALPFTLLFLYGFSSLSIQSFAEQLQRTRVGVVWRNRLAQPR